MRFLISVANAVLDRSPEELIGALLVAAAIAGVMAGIYALGRRKSNPDPSFVGVLNLAAGAACMVLTAGYIHYKETLRTSGSAFDTRAPRTGSPDGARSSSRHSMRPSFGHRWSSGRHVAIAADTDRDGLLTPDEAAGMVGLADTDGDGKANVAEIDRLVEGRFQRRFRPNKSERARTSALERTPESSDDLERTGHSED